MCLPYSVYKHYLKLWYPSLMPVSIINCTLYCLFLTRYFFLSSVIQLQMVMYKNSYNNLEYICAVYVCKHDMEVNRWRERWIPSLEESSLMVFIRPAALRIRKSAIFCGRRFLLNCPLIAVRSGRRAASGTAAIRRTRHSCKNQGLLIALYKHSISVQRIIRLSPVKIFVSAPWSGAGIF